MLDLNPFTALSGGNQKSLYENIPVYYWRLLTFDADGISTQYTEGLSQISHKMTLSNLIQSSFQQFLEKLYNLTADHLTFHVQMYKETKKIYDL